MNEVLIHAATWMNPENIMLSEWNQTQKATYCMIPFQWNIQNRQIQREKDGGYQGLQGGEFEESPLKWVSFWGDALQLDRGIDG